jgi:phage baseplate assembly protein gpV
MNDNENEDNILSQIYHWVDSFPLSKPKKNLARDFSDGGKIKIIYFIHYFT